MPPKRPENGLSKSYVKWVTDVVTRLSSQINLQEWRISLTFDEEDENPNCTAFTCIDVRYLSAYIYFTPNARALWDEGDLEKLIECVTHELTHILLEPLHKFAQQAATPQTEPHLTDLLEQTNQRLARIVIELLPPKFFSL